MRDCKDKCREVYMSPWTQEKGVGVWDVKGKKTGLRKMERSQR